MARKYTISKIKEALSLTSGNQALARQQIIALCENDPKLLQELTRAHLTGIVAYNIERVASGRADKAPTLKPAANPRPAAQSEQEFGQQLVQALSSSEASIFGLEGGDVSSKKTKVSQNHINAIHMLAKKRH